MGMDFRMIMGHELNFDQIKNLNQDESLWKSLADFLKAELNYQPTDPYKKWTKEPIPKNLNEFWTEIETQGYSDTTFYIDCFFGNITIFRKTIKIWFSTIFHSYWFFKHSKDTIQIINIGRIFANHIGTDKILYIPDGYVKTAIIEDYSGSLEDIISKGIREFGEPPKGISKGRKNYFFVDYIDQEIGEIKEWDEEEDFWKWDEEEKEYIQIKI